MKAWTLSAALLAMLFGGQSAQAQNCQRQDFQHHFKNQQINNWRSGPGSVNQGWIGEMQSKINQGIQSGRLTAQEANRLQNKLNRIQNMQARLGADGLTFRERQQIELALRNENEAINRELHDNQFVGSTFFNKYRHY